MNCDALTAVSTLKLMSTLTPVSWSVSLMMGTWGEGEESTLELVVWTSVAGAAQAYCSFVQNFDGMWAGHIVFVKGLLQFLQRGVVPLSKHHQVNVTMGKNKIKWLRLSPSTLPEILNILLLILYSMQQHTFNDQHYSSWQQFNCIVIDYRANHQVNFCKFVKYVNSSALRKPQNLIVNQRGLWGIIISINAPMF